jgi:cytidylate kinase
MDVALFVGSAVLSRYHLSSSCKKKTTSTTSSNSTSSPSSITLETLKHQNAVTSNAILEHYNDSALFARLAKAEGDLTLARDNQDASKLQLGINFAQDKGVIDPNYVPEPYVTIDVLGKTPSDVAMEILKRVGSDNKGSVIVLCGLSGTGKGTTVTKLRQQLEQQGQVVTTWSNGDIFRSVTLLAATWCQQNGCAEFDEQRALTKENLKAFMDMLSFGKNPSTGQYDTRIQGLGLDTTVRQIQNTVLKSPTVSKNIPTVAQYTQGEVILFAANAVQTMGADGICVLLEGREQTVNYVRTPHRFTLTLSDESLIGKRRAAQRIAAQALHDLAEQKDGNNDVTTSLDKALAKMVQDIE